jgi:hypothetical protein
MKYVKLFEELEEPKYATLTFNGVIPNGDTFTGNWDIVKRKMKVPCPPVAGLFEIDFSILENLRKGNFTIEVGKYNDSFYWSKAFSKKNVKFVASSVETLEEFWEEMEEELHDNGIESYRREYGTTSQRKVEKMREYSDVALDDYGCNEDGFREIWDQYGSAKADNFLEYPV